MQNPTLNDDILTKLSTCRICNESGLNQIFSLKEMMYGTMESFDYELCSSCGALQIKDIPDDLARHYPSDYYSHQARLEPELRKGVKGALIKWYCRSATLRPNAGIDRVLRSLLPLPTDLAELGEILTESGLHSANDRILDVGCGSSPQRLAAMRRCGFEAVEGCDPFISADLIYHGVPVYKRTIGQMEGQYGLIMFHHSLEHVPDPVADLRVAARLLPIGATCLVRVPVMGTYFWKHFGENWVELDAPRHLHLMAVDSVHALAKRTGFKVRKIVFESTAWEIAVSMQYERGIPFKGLSASTETFTPTERQSFARKALELNQAADGGRASFYLERC